MFSLYNSNEKRVENEKTTVDIVVTVENSEARGRSPIREKSPVKSSNSRTNSVSMPKSRSLSPQNKVKVENLRSRSASPAKALGILSSMWQSFKGDKSKVESKESSIEEQAMPVVNNDYPKASKKVLDLSSTSSESFPKRIPAKKSPRAKSPIRKAVAKRSTSKKPAPKKPAPKKVTYVKPVYKKPTYKKPVESESEESYPIRKPPIKKGKKAYSITESEEEEEEEEEMSDLSYSEEMYRRAKKGPAKKATKNPTKKSSKKTDEKLVEVKGDYLTCFIEQLDLDISKHKKIHNLLLSLNYTKLDDENISKENTNETTQKIKNIINNNIKKKSFNTTQKCILILSDIYNNNLGDFTLKFSDDDKYNIICQKSLIKSIPYFSMVFEDVSAENTINLNNNNGTLPNYEITTCIIKLLYKPDEYEDIITITNFILIFEQMNIWLMKDQFDIMLKFAKVNIKEIISLHFKNKQINNIVILSNILNSIADEKFIKNNEFSFGDCKKLKLNAKNILDKMFTFNKWNEHIFMFENWNKLFSDKDKLGAIHLSKKYELLNIANVEPNTIITFLANLDYKNDCYQDILNISRYNTFNRSLDDTKLLKNSEECSVITNYYPEFSYLSFELIHIKCIRDNDNTCAFTFTFNNNNVTLTKGSQLLIIGGKYPKLKTSNTYSEHIYTIQKIVKSVTRKDKYGPNKGVDTFDVESAKYAPTMMHTMSYKIILDKVLPQVEQSNKKNKRDCDCSCLISDSEDECDCECSCHDENDKVSDVLTMYLINNHTSINDCKNWTNTKINTIL